MKIGQLRKCSEGRLTNEVGYIFIGNKHWMKNKESALQVWARRPEGKTKKLNANAARRHHSSTASNLGAGEFHQDSGAVRSTNFTKDLNLLVIEATERLPPIDGLIVRIMDLWGANVMRGGQSMSVAIHASLLNLNDQWIFSNKRSNHRMATSQFLR